MTLKSSVSTKLKVFLFVSCHVVLKLPFKYYQKFYRGFCSDPRYSSFDVDQIFGTRHISFRTLSDISCFVLPNPAYRQILREIGFIVPLNSSASADEILRGQIARILLTPNSELHYYIEKNLAKLDRKYVVGVQVRTGGDLSVVRESGRFLYQDTVFKIGQIVKNVIVQKGWNSSDCVVFLTADSGLAFGRVRHDLIDSVQVVSSEGFKAGHSSVYLASKYHDSFLKRAILDLVLLSQSDFVLYTYGSSYGTLAKRLSLHTNFLVLRNGGVYACNCLLILIVVSVLSLYFLQLLFNQTVHDDSMDFFFLIICP